MMLFKYVMIIVCIDTKLNLLVLYLNKSYMNRL